jgi:Ca2+-binding EF-hand superfamily protein
MRPAFVAALLLALAVPVAQALPAASQITTAFAALDTSGNEAISIQEWDAASFALFRAADKNNNNFIDAEELKGSSIAQDTFLRADLDRDGRLSVKEFVELRRSIFHIADIDRNDHLSYVEFELLLLMEQVGWSDKNNNGRIELSELGESLRHAFEDLDTNHDGTLIPEEAAYMKPETFKAYDATKDGKLTVEEFIDGYRNALTN